MKELQGTKQALKGRNQAKGKKQEMERRRHDI